MADQKALPAPDPKFLSAPDQNIPSHNRKLLLLLPKPETSSEHASTSNRIRHPSVESAPIPDEITQVVRGSEIVDSNGNLSA